MRAVISKKAAPIASGSAMPTPSFAALALQELGDESLALLGDLGHLPRQLGRIGQRRLRTPGAARRAFGGAVREAAALLPGSLAGRSFCF